MYKKLKNLLFIFGLFRAIFAQELPSQDISVQEEKNKQTISIPAVEVVYINRYNNPVMIFKHKIDIDEDIFFNPTFLSVYAKGKEKNRLEWELNRPAAGNMPICFSTELPVKVISGGEVFEFIFKCDPSVAHSKIINKQGGNDGQDALALGKESKADEKKELFERIGRRVLDKEPERYDLGASKHGIDMLITNLYIYEDYFFFKIVLENNKNIPYDINKIEISQVPNKTGLKKDSGGKEKSKIITDEKQIAEGLREDNTLTQGLINFRYLYNYRDRIEGKSTLDMVVVYQKFAFSNEEKLMVKLSEKGGYRDLLFFVNKGVIENIAKMD